ncbi:hypothetical protein MMC25_003019 [Agyrium rufum]|nr:hypothetical protein [Agyrium rufum]
METTTFRKNNSLRSHKALPRRIIESEVDLASINGSSWPSRSKQRNTLPADFSQNIQSWIPQPPLRRVDSAHRLPLTPPSLTKEEDRRRDVDLLRSYIARDPTEVIGHTPLNAPDAPSTPINHINLPTPDITPPKRVLDSLVRSSPPPNLRIPSSAAESFHTAVSHLNSEDGIDEEAEALTSRAMQTWFDDSGNNDFNDIGLGLNLEAEDGHSLSSMTTSQQSLRQHVQTMENARGPSTEDFNDHSSNATILGPFPATPRNVDFNDDLQDTVRANLKKSTQTRSISSGSSGKDAPVCDMAQHSRGSPAQEGPQTFTEKRKSLTPSAERTFDIGKFRMDDTRRLSQMSTTSAIVEAWVIHTPSQPQRRQTIRKINKTESLRTASSHTNGSNRSSLLSDAANLKLMHRNMRLSDLGSLHRNSILSDTNPVWEKSPEENRRQTIGSIVSPRRSSLKSSRKRGHVKSLSDGHQQSRSLRPSIAPAPSAVDRNRDQANESPVLRTRRPSRTRTVSIPSAGPPRAIPTRSPSLSAPSSRNVSRATSLTSSSLLAHNAETVEVNSSVVPSHATISNDPQLVNQSSPSSEDGGDDLRSQGHRRTLFSRVSMRSSTPGTLEVNEATAVNIYPHNNHSVLVVQSMSRQNSHVQAPGSATLANVQYLSSPPRARKVVQLVDSPLTKPRAPPKPPTLQIVANPTPALPPMGSRRGRPMSLQGSFGSLKRAFSGRRNSAPSTMLVVGPRSRSADGRMATRIRFKTGNKTSSFWRPRGFWDDLEKDEDDESDFGNEGYLAGEAELYNPPESLTRRKSEGGRSYRSFGRTFGSLKRSASAGRRWRSGRTKDADYSDVDDYDDDTDSLAGRKEWKPVRRLSFADRLASYDLDGRRMPGLQALQDRMVQRRVRREEERRQKEREKLRNSIGMIISQPNARIA